MAPKNKNDDESKGLSEEDLAWFNSLPETGDYEDGELGVTTAMFLVGAPVPANPNPPRSKKAPKK